MAAEEEKMSGVRKAAFFFISLKPELAARVMKEMDKEAIEEISTEIAKIKTVNVEDTDDIFEEFLKLALAQKYIEQGGVDYARVLLQKSLPPLLRLKVPPELLPN